MSDFYNASTSKKCRAARKCISCAETIEAGAVYTKQTGVMDGKWYTNHYHPECFADLSAAGDFVFTPYSGERPTSEGSTP